MGTWGPALYDTATNLRDTVAQVTRVPAGGDRLPGLLRQIHDNVDPGGDDGVLFWLVVADPFEKKRVACAEVTATALRIIDSGAQCRRPRRAAEPAAACRCCTAPMTGGRSHE